MAISPLPTPPQRSDPTNFPARADAFMSALPTFGTEANALQADVNAKQLAAATSESNALASADRAAASASSAVSVANTVLWVSGTTYNSGTVQYSPIDFRSYRRKSTGSGTTDPSLDFTNYVLISNGMLPYLHVRDEKSSGTSGGTATSGMNTRTLNTVVGTNTIAGSSLASNVITLPAGTYEFVATAPMAATGSGGSATNGGGHRLFLYNNTDSANLVVGNSTYASIGNGTIVSEASCKGRFTLSGTKDVILRHYIATAGTSSDLGAASGSGVNEVYASIQLWKIN